MMHTQHKEKYSYGGDRKCSPIFDEFFVHPK
jgi:hypothetical protein